MASSLRPASPRSGSALAERSIGGSPTVDRTCPLASLNPVVFDASNSPDSLDPAVSFSLPGWGAIQQVYQPLVQYNGSHSADFVGVLADSWYGSSDGRNYTFHIRSAIHFSNGDPLNAYTVWFSLNRALVMNQSGAFILEENFWYPGLNYYSNPSASSNAQAWLANGLNTFNFVTPSAAQLAVMEATNQSFQVIDQYTIQLNVGTGYLGPAPYAYLPATLASPIASAVDPIVVQAHGGVSPDSVNAWMSTNVTGTGAYVLEAFNISSGYTLQPDANYWGTAAAASEPWNVALQPARSSIKVQVQPDLTIQRNQLESGAVAGIPSEGMTPATFNALKADPCVVTRIMDPVYGSAAGAWWVYMDQATPPFNNLSVRRAIVHAINYAQIINVAFGGYAGRWVGPVAPGVPYANPTGLAPYAFDLALAQNSMNASPWPLPGGYPVPINFEYVNVGAWPTVAALLKSDLARIGISLNPIPITFDTLFALQAPNANGVCTSETTFAGGPYYMGLEFWTADYMAPDDWTQNDAISYGSANMCMAHYANVTVDALVLDAARATNVGIIQQDYAKITQTMYDNVTDAWLVVPDQFQAYHPSLRGIVPNPMGSASQFALTLNTVHAVPPIVATASETPSPVTVNATATLQASATGGTPPYTVRWDFGDGTNASGTVGNTTHVYTRVGNYTANVTVRDGYGGYATASALVVVKAAPPPRPPPPPAGIDWPLYLAVAIVASAAVAALVLLLLRRRKAEPPGPPETPPSPPPPS